MSDIGALKELVEKQLDKKNDKAEKREWNPAEKLMHVISSNRKYFSKMRTSGSDDIVKLASKMLNQGGFPSKSLHNNLLAAQMNKDLSDDARKKLLVNLIKEFSEKVNLILPAFKSLADQVKTNQEAHDYTQIMFKIFCKGELAQLGFDLEKENDNEKLNDMLKNEPASKALEDVLCPPPPITDPAYYESREGLHMEQVFSKAFISENFEFIKAYHQLNDAIRKESIVDLDPNEKLKAAEVKKNSLQILLKKLDDFNISGFQKNHLKELLNPNKPGSNAEIQHELEIVYKDNVLKSQLDGTRPRVIREFFYQKFTSTPTILAPIPLFELATNPIFFNKPEYKNLSETLEKIRKVENLKFIYFYHDFMSYSGSYTHSSIEDIKNAMRQFQSDGKYPINISGSMKKKFDDLIASSETDVGKFRAQAKEILPEIYSRIEGLLKDNFKQIVKDNKITVTQSASADPVRVAESQKAGQFGARAQPSQKTEAELKAKREANRAAQKAQQKEIEAKSAALNAAPPIQTLTVAGIRLGQQLSNNKELHSEKLLKEATSAGISESVEFIGFYLDILAAIKANDDTTLSSLSTKFISKVIPTDGFNLTSSNRKALIAALKNSTNDKETLQEALSKAYRSSHEGIRQTLTDPSKPKHQEIQKLVALVDKEAPPFRKAPAAVPPAASAADAALAVPRPGLVTFRPVDDSHTQPFPKAPTPLAQAAEESAAVEEAENEGMPVTRARGKQVLQEHQPKPLKPSRPK